MHGNNTRSNAFFLCSRATLSATSVVFRSCFEYGRPSTAKDDDAAVECITLEEPSEVIRRVLRVRSRPGLRSSQGA